MIKYFRDTAYLQISMISLLTSGFCLAAYGTYLLSFSILGFTTFALLIMAIKDTIKSYNSMEDKSLSIAARPIFIFYGVIFAIVLICFVFGTLGAF